MTSLISIIFAAILLGVTHAANSDMCTGPCIGQENMCPGIQVCDQQLQCCMETPTPDPNTCHGPCIKDPDGSLFCHEDYTCFAPTNQCCRTCTDLAPFCFDLRHYCGDPTYDRIMNEYCRGTCKLC